MRSAVREEEELAPRPLRRSGAAAMVCALIACTAAFCLLAHAGYGGSASDGGLGANAAASGLLAEPGAFHEATRLSLAGADHHLAMAPTRLRLAKPRGRRSAPRAPAPAPAPGPSEPDASLERERNASRSADSTLGALGAGGWLRPSCASCTSACRTMSAAICCTRACVQRCPYSMHAAGCALPEHDDWRQAPGASSGACALENACARDGGATSASAGGGAAGLARILGGLGAALSHWGYSSECSVGGSPAPARSSRELAGLIDGMCAGGGGSGWAGIAGLVLGASSSALPDACARARDESGASESCSLVQKADFLLCATSRARSGRCCNRLAPDGSARCHVPLLVRARRVLLVLTLALVALLALSVLFVSRLALCWGRALCNASERPLALAACVACAGCIAFRELRSCARARWPGGCGGAESYARAKSPTARGLGARALQPGDVAHELAKPRRNEALALVLLCGLFAAGSLAYWHAQFERAGPQKRPVLCAQMCAQALGADACAARGLPSGAQLCSLTVQLDGTSGALAEPGCACPYAPLFRCAMMHRTAARTDGHAPPGAPLETGVCVPDLPHVAWAGSIVVSAVTAALAALVALSQLISRAPHHARARRGIGDDGAAMRGPSAPESNAGDGSAECCDASAFCLAIRPRPCDAEAACPGAAGQLVNALLLPLLLPWNALSIYLLPCGFAYARRAGELCAWLLCAPFRRLWLGCCAFRYVDRAFPPNEASIGAGPRVAPMAWALASELALHAPEHAQPSKNAAARRTQRPCLFNRGPDASDVDQGGLGDCWLMSAFACAAEVPGLIQSVFLTREYSARGRYAVRLYDGTERKWVHVSVDEWVPAEGRRPAYAQPAGNEMWVMLLEKAFAKLCGSYAALDGGRTLWALHAMTGDVCFPVYRRPDGTWQRNEVRYVGSAADRRKIAEYRTDDVWDSAELFERVLQYARTGAIIAAGRFNSEGTEVRDSERGVVSGHAYSVLAVEALTSLPSGRRFQLVKLRNPWGSFAWRGDWSDSSEQWARYPDLRERLFPPGSKGAGELGHDGVADAGTFWMSWADFTRTWDHLEVCDRSTGLRDLSLDLNEEDGCVGPTVGCLLGCGFYWCCCAGVGALCCKHRTSTGARGLESAPVRCLRGIPRCCASYGNACLRLCNSTG